MIISSINGKPFSIVFVMFNLAAFCIQKVLITDQISNIHSTFVVYSLMIVSAIFTGVVYSFIYLNHISSLEKQIMVYSLFVKEYDCSIFKGNDIRYIVQLNKDDHHIYINRRYFFYNHDYDAKVHYIEILKNKLGKINAVDMLYIYLYKYINVVLMSVGYFFIWQLCFVSKVNIMSFGRFLSILIILLITLYLYCMVNPIFEKIITNRMTKRDLGFFIEL